MTARGFTLLEVVVVLVLIGLTTTLVAPALLSPSDEPSASLQGVIRHAQDLSLRRGETLVLEVSTERRWTVLGSAVAEDVVDRGGLEGDAPRGRVELWVTPVGSCGWALETAASDWIPPLDPLTCTLGKE